jgi:hypothetical protein
MFNLLKKNKTIDIQKEWNLKGEKYAAAINEMIEFGEKNGWENWKGKEPEDKREHLTDAVISLLKKANKENKVDEFRENFPPSHSPIIKYLEKKSQSIEQFCFVDNQKIAFVTGAAYQKRQAYLLEGDSVFILNAEINAIGKSKQGNVFAMASQNKISTFQGWQGKVIKEFNLNKTSGYGITELIPFNDGFKVLLVTSEGIYIVSETEEKLIHPTNDENEEDWTPNIDMENATLSNNNQFIVVGDQCYDHRIYDLSGNRIGSIGPQSSYPHFCLFSKDDSQLITNSCHFYNGETIGVNSNKLNGIEVEAYTKSNDYIVIDEDMRVYTGLATSNFYILGDAYGKIKAIDKNGNNIWRHFLGSTISGMAVSDDEKTLWVGSSSGILHKLQLGKIHRDKHTIGSGNHYEEFRLLIWKDEPQIWKW